MNIDDSEKIKFIETSLPVETIKYKDIYLWPYLRLILGSNYFSNGIKTNPIEKKKHICLKKKLVLLRNAFGSALRTWCPLFVRKNGVILISGSDATRKHDGKYIDRFFFSIIDNFSIVIPVLNIQKHKKNCFKHYIDEQFIEYIIGWNRRKIILSEKDIEGVNVFYKACDILGITIDFIHEIKTVISARMFYTAWFKKVSPSRIFIVCSYGVIRLAMISIAKDMGVPVIELQHGILEDGFYPYNICMNIPSVPYPDFFFIYGEYFRKKQNIYRDNQIIVTGYPYLNLISRERLKNKDIFDEKYKGKIKNKFPITVASQIVIDKELIKICSELQKRNPQLCIIYKPRIYELYHKQYEQDGFFIETEFDIYLCIQNSSILLTVSSTCAIEALYLGVPVLSVDIDGMATEHLKPVLKESDAVKYASSLEEMEVAIKILANCDVKEAEEEGKIFYARDSERLMKEALDIVESQIHQKMM